MKKYDVIVVGGGFAGCAAAASAARHGCRVLLVEQAGSLGGAAVNCLVNPFMPFFTHETVEGRRTRLVLSAGLFTEICDRLAAYGAYTYPTFHEEYLKLVLDDLLEESGAEVLFHATLDGATVEDGRVTAISVMTKSGKMTLEASQFIDATGDADLSVLAGCPTHLGRPGDSLCQPMTLCFRVANVDKALFFTEGSRKAMQAIYSRWQAEGKTSNPRENVLVFDTLVDGVIHFNTTRVVKKNPVDPVDVSWAEREARRQMLQLFTMLKEELPAFRNAQLLMSAASIGARESRMIDGEHLLTQEELKDCTRFPDAIAAGNYDIDIHNPEGSGTSHYYFPDGQYYTIPYRSLQPKGVSNLLTAGRCISSTHEAQASYRIMPIVCTLGHAAGVGAAVAVKSGTDAKAADIAEVQRLLREDGAFLG